MQSATKSVYQTAVLTRIRLTFHNLIIDKGRALADSLLKLEELIVLLRVEHTEFFTIWSIPDDFQAKWLIVDHLACM